MGTPVQNTQRSRPLLLLERTMYRDGRTPFTSLFTIKVMGELDEGRLRQALARVQTKHPLLRCTVEDAAEGPRFTMPDRPAPIPLRILERSGEDQWQTEARREWVTPFEASREPLVRMLWLRGREVNELMLVGHHCICDGQSGINLLRECLTAYDQPNEDLGAYPALGDIEDIVPAAMFNDRSFQRSTRLRAGMFRLTLFLKQARGGKRRRPQIPTEQMYFHCWTVGNTVSLALAERCRAEGATVLAALSMAFMQAFRDVRGPRGLGKVNTMVNARRLMPNIGADVLFGLAPGVALRTKGLPPPQDMAAGEFWMRARAVKADLTRRIDRFGGGLYQTLVSLERLHDMYPRLVAYFEEAPAVPHLTLSNMGRLDLPEQYRSFRLEKVRSPLVMVSPTPANTVVISSFGGQMEFAIVSDEQSLPHGEAIAIKQRAMEILRICAGLPAHENTKSANEPYLTRAQAT
jgi:Condensation domain